jgi:hypothetical protein
MHVSCQGAAENGNACKVKSLIHLRRIANGQLRAYRRTIEVRHAPSLCANIAQD